VKQGILTTITEKMANGLDLETAHQRLADSTFVAGEAFHANLTKQDYAYLKAVLSRASYQNFFGWEATVFIGEGTMISYCIASAFLSIFFLRKLGHKFWEHER
jgi:5-bromo-4-chloroindolyl phosphate hydrolysis protein